MRRLEATGTHDVAWSLGFLAAHAVPGLETWDGLTFRRAVSVDGRAVHVALSAVEGMLVVQGDEAADQAVRELLGTDDDSGPAERHLRPDPVIGPLVARRPGVRLPGSPDHAETLVRTVIGQQVSVAAAATVTGRVVLAHGRPLDAALAGGPTHAFPTPSRLATVDPASLPMPRARARTVVAVAAALADDPRLVHDDEALLALPGVGPWTVSYLRLRARRDPDVFLPTDLAVRRQLERIGAASTPPGVDDLSAGWAPFRSTALAHLWAEYLARPATRTRREPAVVAP